jgi:hypothetical protein
MKLSTAAAIFFILGVIVGCSTESEDSSAASTRCEDAAAYLAAAFDTTRVYEMSVTNVLAIVILRPGEEGEIAGIASDAANDFTDLLDEMGPPEDFTVFHEALTGEGRDIARGLQLLSEGRSDEGAEPLTRIYLTGDADDATELMPDWIWECGIYG